MKPSELPIDQQIEIYRELGSTLKESEQDGTIPPHSIDWETGKRGLTVYDVSADAHDRFYKFDTKIVCDKCHKETSGCIILEREELKVVDSGGFLILFSKIACDRCVGRHEYSAKR